MVGLDNVDNTADSSKNVASAVTVSAASQPSITTLGAVTSIGADVTSASGVTIGDGAIIATRLNLFQTFTLNFIAQSGRVIQSI